MDSYGSGIKHENKVVIDTKHVIANIQDLKVLHLEAFSRRKLWETRIGV